MPRVHFTKQQKGFRHLSQVELIKILVRY